MKFQSFPLSVISLTALVWCSSASAFILRPMSVSFTPSGSGATQAFQIDNPSDKTIPIEIYMTARDMGLDGQEDFKKKPDIEKQFLVYPPQLLLKPEEKRTIRVTWVGDANPKEELAFRLVAEQLPIKSPNQKNKPNEAIINVLMRYVAAVYVKPTGTKPQVILKDASLIPGKKPQLGLMFENIGTEHQLLDGIIIKISLPSPQNSKIPLTLTPEELKPIIGQNILAKRARKFLIPWPASLPQGPIRVDFELKN
jgi:fimbrial chaperone protein